MSLTVSSPSLITRVARPSLLEARSRGLMDGVSADGTASAPAALDADARSPAKTTGASSDARDDRRPDASAGGGRRVEVRREVTKTRTIEVTVITYSDGTSDTLSQPKLQSTDAAAGAGRADPPANPLAKGAMIDRLG